MKLAALLPLAALGYQLRHHMPPVAQRDFPASGHRLCDADDDALDLASSAGLVTQPVRVMGTPDHPEGRLLLASRPG